MYYEHFVNIITLSFFLRKNVPTRTKPTKLYELPLQTWKAHIFQYIIGFPFIIIQISALQGFDLLKGFVRHCSVSLKPDHLDLQR